MVAYFATQWGGDMTNGAVDPKSFITIPGRGVIRADVIESVVLYTPRQPFTDETTGGLCAHVLIIETRRCVHRFPMGAVAAAEAIVAQAGLALTRLGEWTSPDGVPEATDGDSGPGLPSLPTSRTAPVYA